MKWWIYGLAIVGLLVAGWVAGNKHGKSEIQAVLDEQRATWDAAFTKQVAETAAKDAVTAARNKELEDAWQAKLDTAESNVAGLSARLRRAEHRASGCSVSRDPATTGVPADRAVPASVTEVGRLSDDAWRACAADSTALIEVVTRYNNLRNP